MTDSVSPEISLRRFGIRHTAGSEARPMSDMFPFLIAVVILATIVGVIVSLHMLGIAA